MQIRITIQTDGKLLLEGPDGQRIELDLNGSEELLKNQLSRLDAGMLDALLQIRTRISLPGGFPALLQDVARHKNVVGGSLEGIQRVHIGDREYRLDEVYDRKNIVEGDVRDVGEFRLGDG